MNINIAAINELSDLLKWGQGAELSFSHMCIISTGCDPEKYSSPFCLARESVSLPVFWVMLLKCFGVGLLVLGWVFLLVDFVFCFFCGRPVLLYYHWGADKLLANLDITIWGCSELFN